MPSKLKIKNPLDNSIGLKFLTGKEASNKAFLRPFNPHPGGQSQFFDLVGLPSQATPPKIEHRFIYLCGGVGSGKTMCGAAFIVARAIFDPKARSLITANTYGQLETSTIIGFVEFCDRHNIELTPRKGTVEETAKTIVARRLCQITVRLGSRKYSAAIQVLSAEAFTARTQNAKTPGAGLQVRSIWADEFTTAEKSAFDILNDRLGRGEGTIKGLGVITSTINKYKPYNWTYDLFDNPNRDEVKQRLFKSLVVKTSENTSLDDDFYSSVAAGLTDEHIRIQLEGEYVAVTEGRLINTFRRSLHALYGSECQILQPDIKLPLHLAIDFNRSPSTATIWQIHRDEIRGLREWYLLESDTFELANAIGEYVRSLNFTGTVNIYGDASGNQKTANSRRTNWQIIFDAMSKHGISYLSRVPASNPEIQDSVNGLKLKFSKDEIFVNGDAMPELVKDLESVKWKSNAIDKSDLLRTHLLDGLRYFVWQTYPYRAIARVDRGSGGSGQRLRGVVY